MGVLDGVSSLIVIFMGSKVSGPMMNFLNQAVIPTTMVSSMIFLHRRYRVAHYVGSTVIIVGVLLALWPLLSKAENAGFGYSLIYLASVIPMALSSVFKEYALQVDMDIFYMNFWIALFQFIVAVPFTPLIYMANGTNVSEIGDNIVNGLECIFRPNDSADRVDETSNCDLAGKVFGIYFAIIVVFNCVILVVMRLGSSALVWAASTLALPLAALAFTSEALVGADSVAKFSTYDIIGLAIILLGLVIYKLQPEGGAAAGDEDADVSRGLTASDADFADVMQSGEYVKMESKA